MPQGILNKFLATVQLVDVAEESIPKLSNQIGIGMDSAVIPLNKHNLSLVQTVDFFYPLIDDPYMMGKIALANVVSDVYAVGVTAIDKITLILSSPADFTDEERDIVVPMMVNGFIDAANQAGCNIRIGNIAINPWCIIGGVATSVCTAEELIMPTNACANDVLVLTKPLGTQLATNAYIWMSEEAINWTKLSKQNITREMIIESYTAAIESMSRLNRLGAQLMHKYQAHCATDVTGFGLYGHAENLMKFQKHDFTFIIDTLPIIRNVRQMAQILEQQKLLRGLAVETSGGLLIAMSADVAPQFIKDYQNGCGGHAAWIVGHVESGERKVVINDVESIGYVDV